MGRNLLTVLAAAAVTFATASASGDMLAELRGNQADDIGMVGIELTKSAEVTFEAVGLRAPYSSQLTVYAWMIDHKTRKPVWVMRAGSSAAGDSDTPLVKCEDTKFLEAGRYELYFSAGNVWGYEINFDSKDLYGLLGDLFGGDDDDTDDWDLERNLDRCYVRVSSDEISSSECREFVIDGTVPGALVQYNRLGDDEYVRQGFTLDKDMNIRIYSLVEHPQGYKTPVDYGWIVNVETGERVWSMDRWNTERAGGGRKNRKFDDEVRLAKGQYVLHFVTDDSHAWDQFNMNPPYDPVNWGISLFPGVDFDASAFHLVEYAGYGKPLIDFTRAHDDEFFEQPFELKKNGKLRVQALGEYSDGDRAFVDYGWIENAATGDVVWEMTRSNTDHAGGGDKNRMFDGLVELPAGKYVAFYQTDGSHSYRNWNVAQPFDARAYGMAVYAAAGVSESDVTMLAESEARANGDILVKITRVGDGARRRDKFVLDKPSKVKIYALGEGEAHRMFDYGWIENDETGEVVWEMTYRRTDPAGGADKNRTCEQTVTLDPGTYVVHYVSDGSHSFGDWNAAQPRDARNWGITVSLTD